MDPTSRDQGRERVANFQSTRAELLEQHRDHARDRSPRSTGVAFGCGLDPAGGFERHHCSRRAIFHVELAENVFDVFADRAGFCADNHADFVVAFAL